MIAIPAMQGEAAYWELDEDQRRAFALVGMESTTSSPRSTTVEC